MFKSSLCSCSCTQENDDYFQQNLISSLLANIRKYKSHHLLSRVQRLLILEKQ